jgi:hypothetical protein
MLCHYAECHVLFIGMPNAIRRRPRFYVLASIIEGATEKVYQCIMSTEVNLHHLHSSLLRLFIFYEHKLYIYNNRPCLRQYHLRKARKSFKDRKSIFKIRINQLPVSAFRRQHWSWICCPTFISSKITDVPMAEQRLNPKIKNAHIQNLYNFR